MSDMDNSFEGFDEEPSGGGGNKNFMIAIISIVVLFVIVVVVVGGIFLMSRNGSSSKPPLAGTQAAIIYTQNAQTASAATQSVATQIAQSLITPATETSTPMPVQSKNNNTPTSVVVFPTDTPAPTVINVAKSGTPGTGIGGPVEDAQSDPARTATIAALMTQVAQGGTAQANGTLVNPLTPTALPTTGFMEDFGLPVLSGMAILFIFVIFMARRLRVSNTR
jgi:hypothetical protein